MPRRDELKGKKRERLMQETNQLQQLMLQSRSSVRRSSLKEKPEADNQLPDEQDTISSQVPDEIELPVTLQQEPDVIETISLKSPLTETDIFPVSETAPETETEKPVLTERNLFPESVIETPQQKSSSIKVILPKDVPAARTAEVEERSTREAIPYENTFTNNEEETVTVLPEERSYQAAEAPRTRLPQPRRKTTAASKTRLYTLLLIAALLTGFGGYYFYTKTPDNNNSIAKNTTTAPVPVSQPTTPSTDTDTAHEDLKKVAPPSTNTEAITKPAESNVNKTISKPQVTVEPVAEKKTTSATTVAAGNKAQYKVIMKAYFHDEPDESTRRKAFIIHWNNAVLTPQQEKNGFIYVVFTNHLGQTSKGWLRKKDLIQLK